MTLTPDLMSAPDLVQTFPFPFAGDSYRYSTNVEPAGTAVVTPTGQWGERVVDVDSEYEHELVERARILADDPSRHTVLPHMRTACWDAMLTLMRELAAAYPDTMSLTGDGASWQWRNERLGIAQDFVLGDESTLPAEPLAYIAGQVQEDIVLLDQRDGDLFGDAGVVTFAADWSFGFDVGMTFLEIHGPVPRLREMGVITRARQFLMRLQPNETYRRTNWTLTIGRRLDVSTELYHEWGPDRPMIQTVDDPDVRAAGAPARRGPAPHPVTGVRRHLLPDSHLHAAVRRPGDRRAVAPAHRRGAGRPARRHGRLQGDHLVPRPCGGVARGTLPLARIRQGAHRLSAVRPLLRTGCQ